MKKPLPDAALETPGHLDLPNEDVLTAMKDTFLAPNLLLKNFAALLFAKDLEGPVLDLASGEGENGLFLAGLGLPVIHYFEGLLENPQGPWPRSFVENPFNLRL